MARFRPFLAIFGGFWPKTPARSGLSEKSQISHSLRHSRRLISHESEVRDGLSGRLRGVIFCQNMGFRFFGQKPGPSG